MLGAHSSRRLNPVKSDLKCGLSWTLYSADDNLKFPSALLTLQLGLSSSEFRRPHAKV